MKNKYFIGLWAYCVLISLTGCFKKDQLSDPKIPIWRPDMALPLVNSNMSLNDLINDTQDGKTTLSSDEDGLYLITYRDTTYSEPAENIIVIPDQSMEIPAFPIGNTPEPLLLNYNFTNPNTNNFQGTLTKAELKEGNLTLDLNTNNTSSFNVTLSFPTILKREDGSVFTITKNTMGELDFTLSGNLAEYDIFFNANNELDFTIGVTGMIGTGTLSGQLDITSIKYRILFGTFSTIPLDEIIGSNEVSILRNILTGTIYFEDPSVTFTFENSFGVPINADLNYFRTIDKNNNASDMDAGDLEGTNLISKASSPGLSSSTVFQVNSQNSTSGGGKIALKEALSTFPNRIEYSSNPFIASNSLGFVKDDSRIKVMGELRIPFHGSITEYALQDTFDVELDYHKYIEHVEFDILTENRIPIELSLQVYIVDTSQAWVRLDSFFVDNRPILKAPQVDLNGLVISAGSNRNSSSFTNAQLYAIKGATKLIVKASMKTPNAPATNVKFFTTNNLHIKISSRVKGSIDLN